MGGSEDSHYIHYTGSINGLSTSLVNTSAANVVIERVLVLFRCDHTLHQVVQSERSTFPFSYANMKAVTRARQVVRDCI
jgi:hypothetical protein